MYLMGVLEGAPQAILPLGKRCAGERLVGASCWAVKKKRAGRCGSALFSMFSSEQKSRLKSCSFSKKTFSL